MGGVCKFFLRGTCNYGSRCRWVHPTPEDAWRARVWSFPSEASSSGPGGRGAPCSDSGASGGSADDGGMRFRLMSYNILADQLAHEHAGELYRAVPPSALAWPSREALLLREVAAFSPDVLCLQEVDHYASLQRQLAPMGYDGLHAQRTGGRPDGCATFWRRSAMRLVQHQVVFMNALGLKDNVALLVALYPRALDGLPPHERRHMLLANTHILFNPKRGDVKLGQVRSILQALAAARHDVPGPCAPLLCGDFNSVPGSALYKYIAEGLLDVGSVDKRNVSGQVEGQGFGWRDLYAPAAPWHASPQQQPGRAQRRGAPSPPQSWASARLNGWLPAGAIPPAPPPPPRPLPGGWQVAAAVQHTSVHVAGGGGGGTAVACTAYSAVTATAATPLRGSAAAHEAGPSPGPDGGPRGDAPARSFHHTWSLSDLRLALGECGEGGPPRSPDDERWTLSHSLPLRSAYAAAAGAEPRVTTCHDRFVGCVDYIWYAPGGEGGAPDGGEGGASGLGLRVHAVLQPPPAESLGSGLPNQFWPSDHVSLVADMGF